MTRMGKQILGWIAVSGLAAILAGAGCVGSETIMEMIPANGDEADPTDSLSTDTYEEVSTAGDTEDVDWEYRNDSMDCGDVDWERSFLVIDDSRLLAAMSGVTHFQGELQILDFTVDSESMASLESLRCVDGDLYIQNLRNLTDLRALSNLHTVGGDLVIAQNDNLNDLDALADLRTLGGDLVIYGNQDIEQLDGIGDIRYLDEGNVLYIMQNPKLPTCNVIQLVDFLNWDGMTCISPNEEDACSDDVDSCTLQYIWYPYS